jgi:hypothetical protein
MKYLRPGIIEFLHWIGASMHLSRTLCLICLLVTLFMMYYLLTGRPLQSLLSILIMTSGVRPTVRAMNATCAGESRSRRPGPRLP